MLLYVCPLVISMWHECAEEKIKIPRLIVPLKYSSYKCTAKLKGGEEFEIPCGPQFIGTVKYKPITSCAWNGVEVLEERE